MASAAELREYERKLKRVARQLERQIDRLHQEGYDEAMDKYFDRAMVREAIGLCHPDRHPPERQRSATRVTAWLTQLLS